MDRNPLSLLRKIFGMHFPWNLWIQLMVGVNMVGAIVFWKHTEAKVTLLSLTLSFIIMSLIFARYGFVRLLGLGHILFWTPLCVWLGFNLATGTYNMAGGFRYWIIFLLLINGLSLVIDYVDVFRFWRGEKGEL